MSARQDVEAEEDSRWGLGGTGLLVGSPGPIIDGAGADDMSEWHRVEQSEVAAWWLDQIPGKLVDGGVHDEHLV